MTEYIMEVENLKKWFPMRRSFSDVINRRRNWVKAVDGVSFKIKKGEIFGLIGESGCGKTTTGKLLMKLLDVTDGKIVYKGDDVTELPDENSRKYKRDVQMIFQDPYASMNPRFRIRDVLTEPLEIHGLMESSEAREQVAAQSLQDVKLTPPEDFLGRYSHMLSGGQRQRAATARNLILDPSFIVADEPVSMVDLSTRAEILAMLKEVQRRKDLTYLYITHDLSTARYFTDRIAVMYLGKIVEMADSGKVIDERMHPYTRALIAAVNEPEAGNQNRIKEIPIKGEIPSASNVPEGCRFHPRCLEAIDKCKKGSDPELREIKDGHYVACHLVE